MKPVRLPDVFKLVPAAALSAGLAATLMLSGCAKKDQGKQGMLIPVVTDAVASMDRPVFISTFGSLTSISDVNVKAQVTGKLMEAKFVEGQFVKAGDVLYVIEKAPYEATLKAAQGSLEQDQASLEYNKYLVETNKTLAATTTMAIQTYKQYESNVALYSGKVDSDKAQIQTAKINLEWCDVRALCDGVTGKQLIDPGNIVYTSDVLVNIKQLDPIYADFTVPEKYFSQIKPLFDAGKLTVLAVPQGDTKSYEGKVSLIDNSVSTSTGTIPLRATIANPDRALWPGQFINIKVVLETLKNATVVPVNSIQFARDGQFVFIMRDNVAARVPVEVGQIDADMAVILKGEIKPGERIIRVGTMLLSNGAPVVEAAVANQMLKQKMMEEAQKKAGKSGVKAPPQQGAAAQQGASAQKSAAPQQGAAAAKQETEKK